MPIDVSILARPDLGRRLLRRLARHPVAIVSVASIGVRVGRDAFRMKSGEIDAKEFRARTGGNVGSIGGGALGATAGAVAGSVVPVLGSILGGFAGGLIGEAGGAKLGRAAMEQIESLFGAGSGDMPPDLRPPKRDL